MAPLVHEAFYNGSYGEKEDHADAGIKRVQPVEITHHEAANYKNDLCTEREIHQEKKAVKSFSLLRQGKMLKITAD
ncbi:MAG TPA: hypothetical protein VM935_10670 [Chitinophagaceae bacterium]|nr:hypothetical protein [Chitinophagaceae bacterium]